MPQKAPPPARARNPATSKPPESSPNKRSAGKGALAPPEAPKPRKWSFLDVYEHFPIGPWDVLFKGDVEKAKMLNPKRWAPNIEQDPVKRKKSQGPTPNQEIGGWFVEWAHAHLTGDIVRETRAADFLLRLLHDMTIKLFGAEQNSSTYYKYYLAVAAACVKWGDAWGRPETAKYGRKMLCDYLALLKLHQTPVGIAIPGARVPRGVVGPDGKGAPEFEEVCILLESGSHPKLKKKKLDDGYEVAQWSLRELGQKFKPSKLETIGQQWPLTFVSYKNGDWHSYIRRIKAYDPVIAVSYVGGKLHELRWEAEGGKHKAEVTRKNEPTIFMTADSLSARYDGVNWSATIPLPQHQIKDVFTIGGQ